MNIKRAWPMALLVILFFGPMLAAVGLYIQQPAWVQGGYESGELLQQPLGEQWRTTHWQLVHILTGDEATVELHQQVQRSLGRDAARIRLLAVNEAQTALPTAYHTLIIDPMGNLVMGYRSQVSARQLQKDIKRLLKISRIG